LSRRAFLRMALGKGTLALGAFVAGFGIDALWARLVRGPRPDREEYPRLVLGPYRVHHSVVGYLAVAIGLVHQPVVLIPLGLGIIIGHGRRDRWGFVERVGRG
jgi:hypothetical protein